MDMYAYENRHSSQIVEFSSAEFPEIPPPVSIRPQYELVRTHVVTVSFHKCLSDAEVTKICEALSHESFIRMIQEKIEQDEKIE